MPFVLAMVVTMAWLPVLMRVAARWRLLDQPAARKVHAAPIPRVGGLAMATGVFAAAAVALSLRAGDLWFLGGAAILVVFGAVDDRFDLDYRIKLAGQALAVAAAVFGGGVVVHAITLADRLALPSWISIPLTVVFLVGVTNAINLADGLDGLAGGTTFLCLCALALLSSAAGAATTTGLALAFAGAVLGFLRFNTYPASVFMGDAGSQVLGFAIGVLSVRATQNSAGQISAAIPILLLAVPILDTLSVMAQRIGEGRSPFSADKNHIHHRLLALGFRHHEAVAVIYIAQGALFVLAYFLRFESDLLILGCVSLFFLPAIFWLQCAARGGWRVRPAERDAAGNGPEPPAERISSRLPVWSQRAIAAGLCGYAAPIIVQTQPLRREFRALALGLLAVVAASLAVLRSKPLSFIEKGAIYVTITLLVYLDAVVIPHDRVTAAIGWAAVGVAAVATAIRLRLHGDRRFELTPLDLIVLFMALVVPSLPGSVRLPQGAAPAILKLFILFYAIEMLFSRADRSAAWLRIGTASVLLGLILRPLLS